MKIYRSLENDESKSDQLREIANQVEKELEREIQDMSTQEVLGAAELRSLDPPPSLAVSGYDTSAIGHEYAEVRDGNMSIQESSEDIGLYGPLEPSNDELLYREMNEHDEELEQELEF